MDTREAIAEEWLARLGRPCPRRPDPFRDPVGYTFRHALAVLLDEALAGMNHDRVAAALDSIVQIRAVQDLSPGQALEFLFQLKPILARLAPGPGLELVYSRIDEMALLALDLYVNYRERAFRARSNETRRRVYVLERRFGASEESAWSERSAR